MEMVFTQLKRGAASTHDWVMSLPRLCEVSTMKTVPRLVAALARATAVKFFSFWVLLALFSSGDWKAGAPGNGKTRTLTASLLCWACAATAGWSTWRMARAIQYPHEMFLCAVLGALLVGAIGFAGGFYGTTLLMPHSNQGSLLGIFLTGPLGCMLGAAGGALYSLARRKHEGEKQLIAKLLNGDMEKARATHLECHPSLRRQKSVSSY